MFTLCDDATPNSPLPIFEHALANFDELAELRSMLENGMTVAFMLSHQEMKIGGGRIALGMCCLPSVMGRLKRLFEWLLEERLGYLPTWLILLDANFWETATDHQRAALIFHEVSHCGQERDKFGEPKISMSTGLPVPALRPHDLEEFGAVVRRYGAWLPDIEAFLAECQ